MSIQVTTEPKNIGVTVINRKITISKNPENNITVGPVNSNNIIVKQSVPPQTNVVVNKISNKITVSGDNGTKVIIRGDQGPQGPEVEKGDKGDTGPAGNETTEGIIRDAGDADATYVYTGTLVTGINYFNNVRFESNTKVLSYTGSNLTQIVHMFDYQSSTYTVTTTLSYSGSQLSTKIRTVIIV